jgi:DNA-binding LacI/PurR family transcriptional regulator
MEYSIKRNSGKTLQAQLVEFYRKQIICGDLKPGAHLPAERILTEKFGVSRITVVNALRELAEEGLLERRRGSGTFVSGIARRKKGKEEEGLIQQVGLVLLNFKSMESYYFMKILRPLQEYCEAHHISLRFFSVERENQYKALLRAIEQQEVSGLLIMDNIKDKYLKKIQEANMPMVLVNINIGKTSLEYYRIINHVGKCEENALELLFMLGHRRIAMVGPDVKVKKEIWLSYMNFLERRNCYNETLVKKTDWLEESGFHAGKELFALEEPPTAVFCQDDFIASGIIGAARDCGLEVPKDISVIGSGDYIMSDFLTTTTLRWDLLGQRALQLLDNIIKGKQVNRQSYLRSELLMRQSVAPRRGLNWS